jgi:erythromycin esterase
MRHRLLKFLAEKMSFTVLAMEFSGSDALLLNDYVSRGSTSQDQVLACLRKSWITDTEEMKAVVDWMRDYNAKASDERKLKFIGMDPQGNARAIENVRTYFAEVAPDRFARTAELFRVLAAEDSHALAFAPTKIAPEHRAQLYKLLSYAVLNRARLIRRSSVERWDRALGDLKLLTQFAEFNSGGAGEDVGTRDGYMAENFLDAVARGNPKARFVVWAHNAHICKRDGGAFPALGSFLRKSFGDEYYAFGFAFDSGSFRAQLPRVQPPKINVFHLDPAPTGTMDWYMARAGIANYLIDLRAGPTDPRVIDWLKTAHNLHCVGAFFSEKSSAASSGRPFILSRDFDGLIFLTKGTPTQPIH